MNIRRFLLLALFSVALLGNISESASQKKSTNRKGTKVVPSNVVLPKWSIVLIMFFVGVFNPLPPGFFRGLMKPLSSNSAAVPVASNTKGVEAPRFNMFDRLRDGIFAANTPKEDQVSLQKSGIAKTKTTTTVSFPSNQALWDSIQTDLHTFDQLWTKRKRLMKDAQKRGAYQYLAVELLMSLHIKLSERFFGLSKPGNRNSRNAFYDHVELTLQEAIGMIEEFKKIPIACKRAADTGDVEQPEIAFIDAFLESFTEKKEFTRALKERRIFDLVKFFALSDKPGDVLQHFLQGNGGNEKDPEIEQNELEIMKKWRLETARVILKDFQSDILTIEKLRAFQKVSSIANNIALKKDQEEEVDDVLHHLDGFENKLRDGFLSTYLKLNWDSPLEAFRKYVDSFLVEWKYKLAHDLSWMEKRTDSFYPGLLEVSKAFIESLNGKLVYINEALNGNGDYAKYLEVSRKPSQVLDRLLDTSTQLRAEVEAHPIVKNSRTAEILSQLDIDDKTD